MNQFPYARKSVTWPMPNPGSEQTVQHVPDGAPEDETQPPGPPRRACADRGDEQGGDGAHADHGQHPGRPEPSDSTAPGL